jgi:hypothetical protein
MHFPLHQPKRERSVGKVLWEIVKQSVSLQKSRESGDLWWGRTCRSIRSAFVDCKAIGIEELGFGNHALRVTVDRCNRLRLTHRRKGDHAAQRS